MSEKQKSLSFDDHMPEGSEPFFKASEMKAQKIKVKIIAFRELDLPNSGRSLIMDFSYQKKERSLPLNVTNMKALKGMFGNNCDEARGEEITLIKVLVRNPKTGKEVESLRIK